MNTEEQEEFVNKFSETMKKAIDRNTVKFNKGVCKETCNCVEVAEHKNGGNMVKNYPCLDFSEEKKDLLKSFSKD